jgi:uncharacterized membrane protein
MKIFGREPAFYVGVIEALVAVLVTFNLPGLSTEQAGLVVALVVAIGGALTAWATRDTLLAALVGVVKAGLILGVGYGLTVTDEQIGLIAALVSVIGSGYLRTQTSPADTLVSDGTITTDRVYEFQAAASNGRTVYVGQHVDDVLEHDATTGA